MMDAMVIIIRNMRQFLIIFTPTALVAVILEHLIISHQFKPIVLLQITTNCNFLGFLKKISTFLKIPDMSWRILMYLDNSWHIMAIHNGSLQLMIINDKSLQFLTILTVHDNSWPFMTIHDHSNKFLKIHIHSWKFIPFMTIHEDLWQFMIISDGSWQPMRLEDPLRLLMTLHKDLWIKKKKFLTIYYTSWWFIMVHKI